MTKINIQKVKDDFFMLQKEYVDAYKQAKAKDAETYKSTLKPGETFGFANYHGFYLKENFDHFNDEAKKIGTKAYALARKLREECSDIMTEAPSTDCVNALNALKTIGKPSEELFDSMIAKYGDNYLAYKSIVQCARDNNIHLSYTHECEDIDNLCANIENGANRMNAYDAERFASDGAISFLKMNM